MSSQNAQEQFTHKPAQEDNVPKSQKGYKSISEEMNMEPETAEFTSNRGIQTATKKTKEQARKQLQDRVDQVAKRFREVWKQDMSNEKTKKGTELVLIRAMKSHHPAPRIGGFSFQDVYTNFVEGLKYTVPRYVGQSLEETENAIILS